MPIEILMPALSPTMTEGNLAKWLKKEGDEVHSGDVLAEIETDKATMEVEAVDDGKIGKILVPEGAQGIKVNEPIALLLGEDEDASALRRVSTSLRFAGRGRKAVSSNPISRRPCRQAAPPLLRPRRLLRRCRDPLRLHPSCPRSGWPHSPVTRLTPSGRSMRCAASLPGG